LSIGKLPEGYVFASETCALSTIGAEYVRYVEPGEIVRIDRDGIKSYVGCEPAPKRALCVFEYVYFARPDSILDGQMIHTVRQNMGRVLAYESPVEADLV